MSITTATTEHWHTQSVDAVVARLQTDLTTGLTDAEAAARHARYGPNALADTSGQAWIKILVRQLMDVMNWIFVALGIVAYVLKDYISGSLLIAVGFFNLGMGFSQEYAAEKTLAALRSLSSPTATVIRNGGAVVTVPSQTIVPGDVLMIREGDAVPADARLVAGMVNLETDEALLTGESVPVQKQLVVLEHADEPLGDRINMVYSSTIATKGRAKAVVTAIGMATEIGKVAQQLNGNTTSDRTRLQKSLDKMYVFLLLVAILLVIIVMASVRFKVDYDIAMYTMTVALSVLPAGLTTVMTVTLVLGGREMATHKALVRKLKCLETLGSVTNIFSDKTGTLTLAKMVVVRCWVPVEGHFRVDSHGFVPKGDMYKIHENGEALVVDKANVPERFGDLVVCAALCNDASLYRRWDKEATHDNDMDEWVTSGAPTEVALQVFATKCGRGKPALEAQEGWAPVCEFPFDSTIKRMTTVYRHVPTGQTQAFVKGAVERILPLCRDVDDKTALVLETAETMAAQGLRVIAFAKRLLKAEEDSDPLVDQRGQVEVDLTFVGLAGIYDPPRPETQQAVAEAHRAGILVHMLTGDHPATAVAIAKEIRLLKHDHVPDGLVMTGPEFDALTEEQIDQLPRLPLVVARCSPDTKVKMICAAQRRRLISAMTGDGVNDAPSLKIADVGIAMGKNGSEVARAASDMILTDDNFATIIRAIAEGRRIYQNMQRFLLYFYVILFSSALFLVAALGIRDPAGRSAAPISTVEMIFFYVAVTPPAGLLSVQRASPDVMKEPPRPPSESIFNREIILDSVVYSVVLGALSMVAYLVPLYVHGGIQGIGCDGNYQAGLCDTFFRGRTTLLVVYTFASVVIMAHCRSYRCIEWDMRGLKETFLSRTIIATLVFDIVCLLLFMYIERIAIDGFHILGITWEWALAIGLVVLLVGIGEAYKWLKRKLLRPLAAHPVDELLF